MFCREPGYEPVKDKIIDAEDPGISIPSVLELQLVLKNRNDVDALLTEFGIKQLPIESTLDWARCCGNLRAWYGFSGQTELR